MSFFARDNRYLTCGARLMIHERKLKKTLEIDGPLTTCVASVKATMHEIEAPIAIRNEGFENLIRGSSVKMEEVLERAPYNWYIEAQEAQELGLVGAVIRGLFKNVKSPTDPSKSFHPLSKDGSGPRAGNGISGACDWQAPEHSVGKDVGGLDPPP